MIIPGHEFAESPGPSKVSFLPLHLCLVETLCVEYEYYRKGLEKGEERRIRSGKTALATLRKPTSHPGLRLHLPSTSGMPDNLDRLHSIPYHRTTTIL
jgi:hypothetical protein